MERYLLRQQPVPELILEFMKILNFVTIMYIVVVTLDCLTGYVWQQEAYGFLGKIRRLPLEPWKIPLVAVGMYGCLLLLLSIKTSTDFWFVWKQCMETGAALAISFGLHFGYMGVFLLILADIIRYVSDLKWKILLASLVCAVYLLLDYNLLTFWITMVSFEECLGFYSASGKSLLMGIRNVLVSLNLFVFILYMVAEILAQSSEKARILKLNLELREANRKLEEYARESVKVAETRERNRLAREIHDTLGHSLTGIITGIEACVMIMDVAPEATKEQLHAIAEVARSGIRDVRRSVNALRPDALEHMDLGNALEQMIDGTRRSTGVTIDYECQIHLGGFSQDEEDIIYRIVQESITNAIRHGKATQIRVRIGREFHILDIHIQDNGTGCADIKKGFGLHHMQERLDILGGTLIYDGSHGFVIHAQIPIRWGKEEEDD